MRTRLLVLWFLLTACFAQAQTSVQVFIQNFQQQNLSNRLCQIQYLSYPGVASGVVGGDIYSVYSDANGMVALTNPAQGVYQFTITAPPQRTVFMFLVTNIMNGQNVNVTNLLVASADATFPVASVAWAAAVTDGRYARIGSVGGANLVGVTNVIGLTNSLVQLTNLDGSITLSNNVNPSAITLFFPTNNFQAGSVATNGFAGNFTFGATVSAANLSIVSTATAGTFAGGGSGITSLNGSAVSSGTVGIPYLPVATGTSLGIARPDNSTITVSAGVLSAVAGAANIANQGGQGTNTTLYLPVFTNFTAIGNATMAGLSSSNVLTTNGVFVLSNGVAVSGITNGYVFGNGSLLTGVGLPIYFNPFFYTNNSGQVAPINTPLTNNYAGIATFASQVNVNGVLDTAGAINAGGIITGTGSGITALNGSAISSGTVGIPYLPVATSSTLGVAEAGAGIAVSSGVFSLDFSTNNLNTVFTNNYAGTATFAARVNVAGFLDVTGNVSSGGIYSGNGSGLTALNAAQLLTGVVPIARLPIATSSSLGVIQPDNSTITVNAAGVISSSSSGGGGGNNFNPAYFYTNSGQVNPVNTPLTNQYAGTAYLNYVTLSNRLTLLPTAEQIFDRNQQLFFEDSTTENFTFGLSTNGTLNASNLNLFGNFSISVISNVPMTNIPSLSVTNLLIWNGSAWVPPALAWNYGTVNLNNPLVIASIGTNTGTGTVTVTNQPTGNDSAAIVGTSLSLNYLNSGNNNVIIAGNGGTISGTAYDTYPYDSALVGGLNNSLQAPNGGFPQAGAGIFGGNNNEILQGQTTYNSWGAVIVGGGTNLISDSVQGMSGDAIVGGYHNFITDSLNAAIIAGAWNTNNGSGGTGSVILGGSFNYLDAYSSAQIGGDRNLVSAYRSVILGGFSNSLGNLLVGGSVFIFPTNSVILGGTSNYIGTNNGNRGAFNSVVGGVRAEATNSQSFVWNDGTAPLITSADNQFLVRATGGINLIGPLTATVTNSIVVNGTGGTNTVGTNGMSIVDNGGGDSAFIGLDGEIISLLTPNPGVGAVYIDQTVSGAGDGQMYAGNIFLTGLLTALEGVQFSTLEITNYPSFNPTNLTIMVPPGGITSFDQLVTNDAKGVVQAGTIIATTGIFGNLAGATNLPVTNIANVTFNGYVTPTMLYDGAGNHATVAMGPAASNFVINVQTNWYILYYTNVAGLCFSNAQGLTAGMALNPATVVVDVIATNSIAVNTMPISFAGSPSISGFYSGETIPSGNAGNGVKSQIWRFIFTYRGVNALSATNTQISVQPVNGTSQSWSSSLGIVSVTPPGLSLEAGGNTDIITNDGSNLILASSSAGNSFLEANGGTGNGYVEVSASSGVTLNGGTHSVTVAGIPFNPSSQVTNSLWSIFTNTFSSLSVVASNLFNWHDTNGTDFSVGDTGMTNSFKNGTNTVISNGGITQNGGLIQINANGNGSSVGFSGNGINVTNLNASQLASGYVPIAALTNLQYWLTNTVSATQGTVLTYLNGALSWTATNVFALLAGNQTFSGANTFSQAPIIAPTMAAFPTLTMVQSNYFTPSNYEAYMVACGQIGASAAAANSIVFTNFGYPGAPGNGTNWTANLEISIWGKGTNIDYLPVAYGTIAISNAPSVGQGILTQNSNNCVMAGLNAPTNMYFVANSTGFSGAVASQATNFNNITVKVHLVMNWKGKT